MTAGACGCNAEGLLAQLRHTRAAQATMDVLVELRSLTSLWSALRHEEREAFLDAAEAELTVLSQLVADAAAVPRQAVPS